MTYSIIGILASMLLLITNWDIMRRHKTREFTQIQHSYRAFLYGILAYYITDALWGILDAYRLTALQFVDTSLYFVAMAAALMLWTRYVVLYLERDNRFSRLISRTGVIFLILEIAAVIINFFAPILFWFDENGGYHAGVVHYATLAVQILMFLLTAVYTLSVTSKSEGTVKRRHLTIGLFGIAMILLIAFQIAYPLLPFYAMGYMLGSCVLHSFVVEDERNEYRRDLENSLQRERQQSQELLESREALRDALAAAEEASKAKTAFLSNMSHEIRTPMNAIIGLNNIAFNDPTASEKVKEYLTRIGDSAQHLLGIINDILDMSRIESGRMIIKNEAFSFAKSLEQVNTMISGQCHDKGLTYECRVSGKIDDYYIGDAMKLRQIMINILGNAVKFTPEGGSVSLFIEEGARYNGKAVLKLIFRDTGIGMSREYLSHLFDAFSQEDASSTSKYGSTGLGMPITKSLVELMNGHIEVESEKGKGTVFTVTVTLGESDRKNIETPEGELSPREMHVPENDDDRIALDHIEGEARKSKADTFLPEPVFAENVIEKFCETVPGKNTDPAKITADLKGRRILLAEDVSVNAEIMMMLLSMREMQVELAENGQIAVEKFTYNEPGYYDAILMDMRMPVMDGLEATRTIRAMGRPDAAEIPIIALTANAFDEDVQRSMQAGLNAHLSKPVEPEALFETLETLIKI